MSAPTELIPGSSPDDQAHPATSPDVAPAADPPADDMQPAPGGVAARPVIAVALLTAHPGNVRRDLDLNPGFVASIEANGVLVPLRITPAAGGYRWRVSLRWSSHPFLRLRDGTHPLAVGPGIPGLLLRPGRSDRPRRQMPGKLWRPGRRIVRKTAHRRQPIRRSGRDPGTPNPTPPPGHHQGSRARSTIHTLPADSGWWPVG
jgi:hypothetical protein